MKPKKKTTSSTNKIEKIERKKYTKESVEKALKAISNGMSKKLASKTFQVPRSTLQFKTKFPNKRSRPGPSTVLFENEEIVLKNWIVESSRKGFPKRKEDLLASVAEFFKKNKRQNPFKNGIPGEKWYKLFLGRHPDISMRTPESVTSASAAVAEEDIKDWFKNIFTYLEDNNLLDILSDPKRIYNGDETNFLLCPKTGVVLSAKGDRNVYEVDHAPAKTSLTVLFTFGADGSLTPPLVIFPYKRLPSEISAKVPNDWGIGLSDNGWMKADIFLNYIKNVFHPHLVKTNIKFPIILYVDGHKTHLTYEISQLCTDLNIVLIALYPNCTRILQPADVSAFKPMKVGWQKIVQAWRREHPSQALTKLEFAPLLKKTIDETMNAETIKNGFRATGLYPFNKDAVDYTKCLGKNKSKETSTESEINRTRHLEQIESKQIKMTIQDLKKIVDARKWEMIVSNNTEVDEDLRKIYKFFTSGHELIEAQVEDIDQENNIENMQALFAYDYCDEVMTDSKATQPSFVDISESALIDDNFLIHENPNPNVPITHYISMSKDNGSSSNEITITDSQASQPIFLEISETALIHDNVNLDRPNIISNVPVQRHMTETPGNLDKIDILSEHSLISVPNSKSINLTPIKLNDLLVLPKTPQRKGVRNIPRTSFVLTSLEWKEQESKKKREKEEKAEGIKKRKEERERKKLEKPMKIKKEKNNQNKGKPKKDTKKVDLKSDVEILQPQNINLEVPSSITEKQNVSNEDLTDIEMDYDAISIEYKRRQKICSTSELEKILAESQD